MDVGRKYSTRRIWQVVLMGTMFVVALSLASASSGSTNKSNTLRATAPPAFTAAQLAAPAGANWIDFGGDSRDDHYSSLNSIKLSNANQLQTAWHIHLPEAPGLNSEGGGIAYNGVYYYGAGDDDIYAINGSTGAIIWEYKPSTPQAHAGLRGIAMGDGKIYFNEYDNYIVALNATTGAQVWKIGPVGDPTAGEYNPSPITYANGMLFSGTGGSDSGIRGFIAAYNASNGKQVWKTYVVPAAASDPGFASWGAPADLAHGGGGDWGKVVADPAAGVVYAGTANAEPYANRPKGDDLYTSSDIELNMKTGKFMWGYQIVHHDTWDIDASANNLMLYNFTLGGKTVQALDQPTKLGTNFILNRQTGKPFKQLPIPEIKVPTDPEAPNDAKTQPVPTGEPFGNTCSTPQEWIAAGDNPSLLGPDGKPIVFGCNFQPVVSSHYVVPGWHDTADWPPDSFSRTTGLVYVCSTNTRGDAYEAVPQSDAVQGAGHTGYGTENVSELGGDWVKGQVGVLTAIDPRTNDIVWKRIMPDHNGCYSGVTTTAGRLVFVELYSGHLVAYDAGNGNLIWQSPQMDASGGAPSTVYTGSDGREYVTVTAMGLTISAHSTVGNSIYSFALPG
jgi:quinohemoprotein ethanol dehydrogenase